MWYTFFRKGVIKKRTGKQQTTDLYCQKPTNPKYGFHEVNMFISAWTLVLALSSTFSLQDDWQRHLWIRLLSNSSGEWLHSQIQRGGCAPINVDRHQCCRCARRSEHIVFQILLRRPAGWRSSLALETHTDTLGQCLGHSHSFRMWTNKTCLCQEVVKFHIYLHFFKKIKKQTAHLTWRDIFFQKPQYFKHK